MAATAKKPARMKANVPFIPSEIMANIFKRLPARSLTRFQCVSKDWKNLIKSLIKDSSFVKDHLHYSSHQNPSLLLEQYRAKFRGTHLTVFDRDMRAFKVQNLASRFNCEVVGSCNGLVCVKMVDKGMFPRPVLIWNPVTGEARKVPPKTCFIDSEIHDRLGFGFSPFDNDYKIVRIIVHHNYGIKAVEVYSLNSGSWKEVDFEDDYLMSISINGFTNNITINGVMHFEACWADDEHRILSVDALKKVCTLMPTPFLYSLSPRCLIEHENKLALVECSQQMDRCDLIQLWVMKEDRFGDWDGKEGGYYWTKIYVSSPCPCRNLSPVTATWRNEIVLLLDSDPYPTKNDGRTKFFHLLNPKTNVFRRLAVGCCPYNYGIIKKDFFFDDKRVIEIDIFNYVESFVSVDGREY